MYVKAAIYFHSMEETAVPIITAVTAKSKNVWICR